MSRTAAPASPLDNLKAGLLPRALAGVGQEPDRAAVRLGPFVVGRDGLLRPSEPGSRPAFSVRWRGRLVQARLEAAGAGADGTLALETVLGCVPSTASCSAVPVLRERVFALARILPGHLPPAWRVRLLPDHRIGVEARIALRVPVAASDLLAGLTSFLLCLGAYFDVVEETGAGFAPSSAGAVGTAKICPG